MNAGNQDHDYDHIVANNKFDAKVENAGPRYSQLAIQGPRAKEIMQRLTPVPLDPIRYYHFAFGKVNGVECLIARTGYTGEDGFEIYFSPEYSEKLWMTLMQAGEPPGFFPADWARATRLRLEAGCAFTATKSTRRRRRWKRGSAGSASWRRDLFSAATILNEQKRWA